MLNIRFITKRDGYDDLPNVLVASLDFEAITDKAIRTGKWQYEATWAGNNSRDPRKHYTECCVAFCDPKGRVAASYDFSRLTSRSAMSLSECVYAALRWGRAANVDWTHAAQACKLWGSRNRQGGSSHRGILAQAACRMIHAKLWDYVPDRRDELYSLLWDLDAKRVVEASDELLEACAALMAVEMVAEVANLLADRVMTSSRLNASWTAAK